MIEIIPPQTTGELIAWISAGFTILYGLFGLIFPRTFLKLLRVNANLYAPQVVSAMRSSMAGFPIAMGLLAILFAQPLIWMVLGAGWAVSAIGRIISIIFDRGFTVYNLGFLILEMALAAAPLAYSMGYIA